MRLLGLICLLVSFWPLLGNSNQADEVWLLIDGGSGELRVMRGNDTLRRFAGISVGRAGIGVKRRQGDDVTPTGEFRIAWESPRTKFHRFYGINWPSAETVELALAEGVIDTTTHSRMLAAHRRGEVPPQYTPLGGQLGIHGLGAADPQVHKSYNWTRGCVALTNSQVDELSRWVGLGTRVVIR